MQGDENLFVKFYDRDVYLEEESRRQGRPISKTKVYVSIIIPGDGTTKVDRQMHDGDKDRFPKQWLSYQTGKQEEVSGTSLNDWPALTAGLREELRGAKFYTVESIAGASDSVLSRIQGGFSLREKAKAFIKLAQDSAAAQKYAADNQELRDEIVALRAQIAEISKKHEKKLKKAA